MIYPIQLISMALFANDGEDAVNAWDADPNKLYWCLECKAPLKMRKGPLKLPHFYHLSASPSCRLYSKSERHLLIQLAIQKKLPPNETILEKRFPSIRRIADVFWEKQNIVFEIQCSAISEEEVKERTIEYRALGCEIIWILDERLFNKNHASKAELFIRSHSGYFIEKGASFAIYDQLETFKNFKRIKKGEKTLIDLSTIKHPPPTSAPASLPRLLKERIQFCKYFFENDWIARSGEKNFALRLHRWHLEETLALKSAYIQRFTRNLHAMYRRLISQLLKKNQ